jgi:hypothetical protein
MSKLVDTVRLVRVGNRGMSKMNILLLYDDALVAVSAGITSQALLRSSATATEGATVADGGAGFVEGIVASLMVSAFVARSNRKRQRSGVGDVDSSPADVAAANRNSLFIAADDVTLVTLSPGKKISTCEVTITHTDGECRFRFRQVDDPKRRTSPQLVELFRGVFGHRCVLNA